MINIREKGNRGEREFAAVLRRHGYEAERGQQRSGSPDSPDVRHNVPGVHFEVKRTERLALRKAMEQAGRDCGSLMPVVAHRSNGTDWVVALRFDDFMRLCALRDLI